MSRTFRFIRKYAKVFLWAIAVLVIPSFILWGVGSAVRDQNRARFAGTMFNRKVPWNEFDQAYKTTVMLLVLSDQASYIPFLDLAGLSWERLILLQEIKKRKIQVADREVIDYVQRISAFRDPEGFNRKRYQETLQLRFQTSPRTFEEEIRKTLAFLKLRDQVVGEVQFNEEELWKEYQTQYDKRRIALLELRTEDFKKEVALTEEELKSYFETNAAAFERPERIRLQTAGLAFEGDNQKEVKRRLDEASDGLADPAAFETVAKEHRLTFLTTEFFSLFESPPDLADELLVEATRLEPGKISDPVETPSGIYLVKFLEKKPPQVPSFEEARQEVEEALKQKRAEALCQEKTRDLLREIQAKMKEASLSFEAVAKTLGYSLQEPPAIGRGETEGAIGATPELNRAAFALSLGEVGGTVRTPKGFAILQPKEEIPASRENFDKEKEPFRQKTVQRKQFQHYNEWFQVLKANAKLQSNLEARWGPVEPAPESQAEP